MKIFPVDQSLVDKAKTFAQHYHTWQLYGDGNDYFLAHLVPVAQKAMELAKPLHLDLFAVEIFAYLHDVLEDCEQVTSEMVEENFGKDILDGVLLLSNRIASIPDSAKTADEYFSAIGAARPEVKIVKIADRNINYTRLAHHLDEEKRGKLSHWYVKQVAYFQKYDIFPELLS